MSGQARPRNHIQNQQVQTGTDTLGGIRHLILTKCGRVISLAFGFSRQLSQRQFVNKRAANNPEIVYDLAIILTAVIKQSKNPRELKVQYSSIRLPHNQVAVTWRRVIKIAKTDKIICYWKTMYLLLTY